MVVCYLHVCVCAYVSQGCFTAVPLAFIIPTACYLKLSNKKWLSVSKLVAMAVMVFGILVMVIGTVLAVIEVSGLKESNLIICLLIKQ